MASTSMQNDSTAVWGTYRPKALAAACLGLARFTPMGRGKARRVLSTLFVKLHPGPVDSRLWGVPFRLYPQTNKSELKPLFRLDHYDRRERAAMHEILDHDGALLIDIGANMGLYSFDAVINGPPGTRAIAVEPQPRMAERITFNVETARAAGVSGVDRLTLMPVAASDQNGSVRLDMTLPENIVQVSDRSGAVEIPALTLLEITRREGLTHIDCLKLDIEGHEGVVLAAFLREATDTILPRRIIFEVSHSADWLPAVTALLEKRGYSQRYDFRANLVYDRPTLAAG